eukprot:comp22701_c0_seq1/m.35211 comp22701_c0_seq1/g.35211  ORF comp22701_c0_seq1/g.35211 comp22701_c0_seq1/m.35211 type:complete len:675 (-) comp22701_c0_seq1:356-2380(-)
MAGYGERTVLGLRQMSTSQANIITGRQSLGPQRAPSKDTSAKAGIQRQSLAAMPRTSIGRNELNSRPSLGFGSSAPRFSLGKGASANLNKTMGGHTTILNNRRSSLIGTERGPVKDTRPLADKKFQKHCIIEMVRYVTENNYPHPISEKIFTTFMMRDYYKIFTFLYLRIDPNYRFNNNAKTQEMGAEIQKALTLCGYPYTINKSALTTWTPTTWPHLLGIIHYLVQQAKEMDASGEPADPYSMAADDLGDDDFAEMRIIAEYTNRCYEEFLFGADEYPQHEPLLQPFTERSQALLETIERNNEFIADQQRLLQEMEGTDPMVEAKAAQEGLLSDKAKFEKLIAAKKKSLAKHTAGKEEAAKLLAAKLEEKKRLEGTVAAMKDTIKQQRFDPVQVREMNNKYAAAQERIRVLQQEKEDIKAGLNTEQGEEDRCKEEVRRVVDTYNGKVNALAPAMPLVKVDVDPSIPFQPNMSEEEVGKELEYANKCLMQLKQQMGKAADILMRQRSEGERKLEKADVEYSDMELVVGAWRQKVDQFKADEHIQRRALAERIEKMQQEADGLEREGNNLTIMADADRLAKDRAAVQDRYQREERAQQEAVEFTDRCLSEAFEKCSALYSEVRMHLQRLHMEARERRRLGESVDVDGPIPDWMAALVARENKIPSPPQGIRGTLI